ncbi:MAG: ADP-ribosylglycohydrolase family protein [Steroidobacteraceae bacterium]
MKRPLPNTYWVQPGIWLAGEYPGGEDPKDTRERLARFAEAGIDCFIDLTETGERIAYAPLLPKGTQYHNVPLPDHSVPHDRAQMRVVLDAIDRALADGRHLYVHCRAGIGRTGMSVACSLVAQGMSGENALKYLNELWQANARAKRWPRVPETEAQAEYVRQWGNPADSSAEGDFDSATLSAARKVRERFQGALIGLAVGDALAAATQYRKPGTFAPVGDLLGGGPFDLPRGGWSDDTAMALCLAESLIEMGRPDLRDQLERYQRWQREGHLSATGECLGITTAVARSVALAGWRRNTAPGSHDPAQLDKEPLSRLAPAVMFHLDDLHLAMEAAADAARASNQAPIVLDACRLFAALLHAALTGRARTAILQAGIASGRVFRPEVAKLAAALPQLAAPPRAAIGVLDALGAALWAFAVSRDFRDGALKAVNLGGDSDVVGAVYGALAGAHYGVSAIPASWRNALLQAGLIADFADRLLGHALQGLGDSDTRTS